MSILLDLTISAAQAIFQITCICCFGFFLRYRGFITNELHKGLSDLNIVLFTPCLLFYKMASSGSVEEYKDMWPILLVFIVLVILSYISSFVGARMFRLSKSMELLTALSIMFSNTNSVPISLIQAIAFSPAAQYLKWKETDTSESIEARGVIYIIMFSVISNIARWSYGVRLISNLEQCSQNIPEPPNDMPRPEATRHLAENKTTEDLPQNSYSKYFLCLKLCFRRFLGGFRGFMNPPLVAILLAFIVSMIPPIKELFFGHSPVFSPLSNAIYACSQVAIPSVLISLGGNIYTLFRDSRRVPKKMVFLVMLARFLLVPAVTFPLLLMTRPYFVLGSDPAFLLAMMILVSSPTAINLLMICQSASKFEDELSMVLLYSYTLSIPIMIGSITLFLYVIQYSLN